MKRIGLVTLFRDNYGSELQCYATKTFLKKLGYECDLLFEQNTGTEKLKSKIRSVLKIIICSLRYPGFWNNRKSINKSIRVSMSSRVPESQFGLDWFCESVLQPKGVDTALINNIKFQAEYEYFIAGSDQIWNGGYLVSPFMFLEFAEDSKKVALCPSMSVEQLKNFNITTFRKSISKFKNLSAREESGVRIIKELTGRTVPRLADPVMLLPADEWANFSEHGIHISSKYIFLHFLGLPNELAIKSVKLLSDKYKVICFANSYKEFESITGITVLGGTPYDYVSLIKNAEFVFTDSFHTTHFSIIFDSKFFVFDRNYGHSNKQSTRIQTLISIYKCPERFISESVTQVENLLKSKPDFQKICQTEHQNIVSYLEKSIPAYISTNQLKPSENCTGCMACVAICPKNAISVSYSKFGYRIPKIDTIKCVDCKQCEKVCNYSIDLPYSGKTEAYISYNKDSDLMLQSASGGVFSALAKSFIESGGLVAAAKLSFVDGKPIVTHVLIDKICDLFSVLGSKYVESDCTNIYLPIARMLVEKKRILFCGTSCQVKALYSFLNSKRINCEELYTIDLICHGVPGIKLFSDYISYIGKKNNGQFSNLQFRTKKNGDIRYQISGNLASGLQQKHIDIPISQSSYYDMFIHQENYREQCYHCEYASIDKPADITIGDYFEAKEDYPSLFSENGDLHDAEYLNCLIVRSENGKKLLNLFGNRLFLYPVDTKRVQLSHSNLCKPSNYSHVRYDVLRKYYKNGYAGVEKMYGRIFSLRKFQVKMTEILKKIIKRGI